MNINLTCLACGSTDSTYWATASDAEYLSVEDKFVFHHCQQCRAIFIDPVPLDRLSQIYPSNYYSFLPPKKSLVFKIKSLLDKRIFKNLLAQIPGDSINVLDVGGGAGSQLDFVKSLDTRIKTTCVVDLDKNAERIAREKGHDYFCGRIEDYKTDTRFDLVILLNLIEHVNEPGKVLEKVRAMLSPNGVAIIKTPNYDALDARIFRNKNWGGYHCPRHWVIFSKESFEALTTHAGLKVKHFAYTQGAPFWAASILFWLADKKVIKVTKEKPAVYHPLFPLLSVAFSAFDFMRRPFAKTSQMFFILTR